MHNCTDTQAVCRGCGQPLNGSPYFKGGTAYVRRADGSSGAQAKRNYYGGWVCSRRCDYNSCEELEESMPGHGWGSSKKLDRSAQASVDSNWPEE